MFYYESLDLLLPKVYSSRRTREKSSRNNSHKSTGENQKLFKREPRHTEIQKDFWESDQSVFLHRKTYI